jgi:hypothetical protein
MPRCTALCGLVFATIIASFANAQTPTVIKLSCDGNARLSSKEGDANENVRNEPVHNMGAIINLADQTVIGFGLDPVSRITRADSGSIQFETEEPDIYEGSRLGTKYVLGVIDRVTGAAQVTQLNTPDNTTTGTISSMYFDLICKVTNRLF